MTKTYENSRASNFKTVRHNPSKLLATSSLGDEIEETKLKILHFWVHLVEVLESLILQTITHDSSELLAASSLRNKVEETEQVLHLWIHLLKVLEFLVFQTITYDLSKLLATSTLWDKIEETELKVLHFWIHLLEVLQLVESIPGVDIILDLDMATQGPVAELNISHNVVLMVVVVNVLGIFVDVVDVLSDIVVNRLCAVAAASHNSNK